LPAARNGPPLSVLLNTIAGELAQHGHPDNAERLLGRATMWQQADAAEPTRLGEDKLERARAAKQFGARLDSATGCPRTGC
jgi:hypothetical protein